MDTPELSDRETEFALSDEPAIDRVLRAVTAWLKLTFIVGGVVLALATLSTPILGGLRSVEIFAILGFYAQVCILAYGLLAMLRQLARGLLAALLVAFVAALPVTTMTFWVVERLKATAGEELGWGGIFGAGAKLAALVALPLGLLLWRSAQGAPCQQNAKQNEFEVDPFALRSERSPRCDSRWFSRTNLVPVVGGRLTT